MKALVVMALVLLRFLKPEDIIDRAPDVTTKKRPGWTPGRFTGTVDQP